MIVIYGFLIFEFIVELGFCIKLTGEIFRKESGGIYLADGPVCAMF